jgi:hypothetical protein
MGVSGLASPSTRSVRALHRAQWAGRFAIFLWAWLPGIALAQDFELREHLGKAWTHELVTFPLTAEQRVRVPGDAEIIGTDGQALAGQIVEIRGRPYAAFQVTLGPGADAAYRLAASRSRPATGLWVEESDRSLRLGNAHIGIELRKVLQSSEAPIGGVRLRSGAWTSSAAFSGGASVNQYRVELVDNGPVYSEALCAVDFSDGGWWTMRVRVLDDEPVVLISETFDAPGGGRMLVPLGGESFRPDNLLYRRGKGRLGQLDSWPIPNGGGDETSFSAGSWLRGWLEFGNGRWMVSPVAGEAFTLEPWLRWWMNERQGNWFGVHTPPGLPGTTANGDLLMVGALKPSQWKDPHWDGKAGQVEPVIPADVEQGVVVLQMPLGGGARQWMLATPDLRESLAPLASNEAETTPLPQRYLIKHGDFPLDEVKDYVLEWPADGLMNPHLFVSATELSAVKQSLVADPAEVERWVSRQPIDKYNIEAPLEAWFASDDERLGEAIVKRSQEWLEMAVGDDLLDQGSRVTLGVAPHNQSVQLLPTLNLADAALGCDCLGPEQRKRMLAQIAFLAYALNREDYWSPERGFEANPNMTTTVALYRTALAALIRSHPMAAEWAENGLSELRRELLEWSDEDGGWLEAPHYAMVSLDHILGAFVMARNADFSDDLFDPRVRRVIEWLAKISTPPDWRIGGFRHFPPIGNTYVGETTGLFGIVAGLWRDRDPVFAANMQWMSEQQGWPEIGLLGPFGTFSGYRSLLRDNAVQPTAPDYGSEWFRDTGVVLRDGFGTERETYLHLIAGQNHEHYDYDSGSIVLWGKGSLLADDFGYIGRHAEQWHSLLTSPSVPREAVMRVKYFSSTGSLDFVSGEKGAWVRQIALLRDAAPLGPTGFLLRDTLDAHATATWRLWLTARSISINDQGAVVSGVDDVDLDIFLREPGGFDLATETTIQPGKGRRGDRVGPIELEQTALVATLDGRGSLTALLLPRLKSEPSPQVSWLAGGDIARVETRTGIDYIRVGDPAARRRRIELSDPDLEFDCAVCAVQVRDDFVTLSIGASGRVRWRDQVLESESAASRVMAR